MSKSMIRSVPLTKMMWRLFNLLTLCLQCVHFTEAIRCEAPAVSPDRPANITCYFDDDVRLTKKNVKVQKTAPGTETFDPDSVDTVVECFWSDAETFNCDAKDGYALHGTITDRATVEITRATKTFEGKYMCETVPSDPSDIQPCTFYLKEGSDAINIGLSVPGEEHAHGKTSAVGQTVRFQIQGAEPPKPDKNPSQQGNQQDKAKVVQTAPPPRERHA